MTKNYVIHPVKNPLLVTSAIETLNSNLTMANVGNLLFQHAFNRNIHSMDTNVITVQDQVMPGETLDKIKVPVVVVGIDAQCETNNAKLEVAAINDDVPLFYRKVLTKSLSIGVRAEFTANYRNYLGIKNIDAKTRFACCDKKMEHAEFPPTQDNKSEDFELLNGKLNYLYQAMAKQRTSPVIVYDCHDHAPYPITH